MKIRIKQIEEQELENFVFARSTGEKFNESLLSYFSNSGWVGPNVLYTTGIDQNILGQKTFNLEPFLPTGSLNLSGAASKLYTNDHVSGRINQLSGWASGSFISRTLDETVGGIKTFTSNAFVPRASNTGHATNLRDLQIASGVLRSGIDNVTISDVLFQGTTQRVTGQKIFDASPLVVTPTNPSGAVPLSYVTGLSITTAVSRTGLNENINGVKTFVQSPVVPVALSSNQAVNKAQLDAGLANVAVGTGSIQGVTNVNGISGSVVIDGAGGITVLTCSGILYVSGNAQSTNFYSVSIPLSSGITGISFSYNPVFSIEPNVVGTLEYAGQGSLGFIQDVIYNSTTGGFGVAFSSGIPSTGYFYNINAIPVSGGSGLLGLQGDRGFPAQNLKQRGRWQAGLLYTPYDVVFTTPNFVSYWTTGTAISDSFNGPSGTGTSLWQILSSGLQGPTGYFIHQGTYNSGRVYNFRDSVIFDGSTYVYSGSSPVSGINPEPLTGGWGLVAAKAPLGFFINSGVITGNFTTLSFYLSPVNSGMELAESFVTRSFFFTGFALGAITSGRGPVNGGILTGVIYQRDTGNTRTNLQQFTFDSGRFFFRSGNFSQIITGDNRIGIDIRNTLSGLDKFSVGIYGFGT